MKNDKNIAVIIPTYKPQEYLKKCLASIDAQTLSKNKFCVYIALNGDRYPYENEVLSLLKTYSFKSKYIYIEKASVSNARNRLIDCSKEDFIAFIDDDDLISPNYLSNLLEVATEEYVGIAKIYSFKKNVNDSIEGYFSRLYERLSSLEISKIKAWKYYGTVWAKLVHRNMIGNIRFDSNLKILEDSLFFITISKNTKGFKKPKKDVYYYYLDREESASRKKNPLIWRLKNDAYFIKESVKLSILPQYNRLFILVMIMYVLVHFLRLVWKKIF